MSEVKEEKCYTHIPDLMTKIVELPLNDKIGMIGKDDTGGRRLKACFENIIFQASAEDK